METHIPDPDNASKKMGAISDAMSAVANFAKVMKPLKGMTAGEVQKTYGGAIRGIARLMGYASYGGGDTIPELMGQMTTMNIGDPGLVKTNLESLISTVQPMTEFAKNFRQFITAMKTVKTDSVTAAVDSFIDVITEMQYLHDTLAVGIPSIDLGGVLNKFGENMSISSEKITVNNKPINITVNLSLTMDADEITMGLAKRKGKYAVALSMNNGNAVSGTTDMSGTQ